MVRQKKRMLLVGAGSWGRTWLPLIEQSPVWELAGVAEPNRSSQRALPPTVRVYPALAKALKECSADAVLLATPHPIRLDPIRQALKARVHVLAEKPLSTSLDEARRIARLARSAPDIRIMVAQNYRFTDISLRWQKRLAQKLLGSLGFVQIRYFMDIMRHLDFRGTYRDETSYDMVLEMGVHHFDLLRWLTGREVRSVYAKAFQVPWQKMKKDFAVQAVLELDDGTPVAYNANWAAPDSLSAWYGDWEVGCSKGFYFCDGLTLRKRARGKTAELLKERTGISASRALILKEFHDALVADRQPQCHLEDNLKSLAVCFAVIASAEKGRPIEMEKILDKMGVNALGRTR